MRTCLAVSALVAATFATSQPAEGQSAPLTLAGLPLTAGRAGAQDGAHPCDARRSLDGAWWTGPMLANSAATLPRGHLLLEPYLYDVTATSRYDAGGARRGVPRSSSYGSLTYAIYGLTDRVSLGLIPTAGFTTAHGSPSSSGVGIGDVTSHAQFRLTQFRACHWTPAISIAVQETFPTGRYDRLGDRPSNGFGAGAFTTTVGLYSQMYFWLPTGRLLRMRLNASQALSSRVNVQDASVYGTTTGFRGQAMPGSSSFVDAAWEYSLTQRWVLALDATYRHARDTRVDGYDVLAVGGAGSPQDVHLSSGTSDAFGLAPAIEYSWTSAMGVLLGTRIIAAGHNTAATVTPAVAVNIVR